MTARPCHPNLAILTLGNVLAGAGLGVVYAVAIAAIASTSDIDRASAVAVLGGTIVLALLIIALPRADDVWGGAAAFAVMSTCCLPALWLVRALADAAEHGHGSAPNPPLPVLFLLALVLLSTTDQGAWSYSAILGEDHAGLPAGTVSAVLSIAAIVALAGVGLSTLAARTTGRLFTMATFIAFQGLAKLVIAAVPSGPFFIAAAMIWQICYMGVLVQVLAVAAEADPSGRWVAAAGGAGAIGAGLGPAPAGWILDTLGAPAFGVILAVSTAVAAVPLLRTTRAVETGNTPG